MGIRKRQGASGIRWQARFKRGGTERTATFDALRAARTWLAEQESQHAAGAWIDPQAAKIRFRDWTIRWTATVVDLRESTQARDLSVVRSHLLPAFGGMTLAEVDHLAVRAWVASLRRLAPETVHKYYGVLSKIMQAAVDARVLAHNPCDNVPLPRIEHREMRFLTADELERLADTVPDRYRALVLLLGYGGLRIGEAAALKPSHVDLLRGVVRVTETAVEVQGHLRYGPPKTKASRRSVPVPRGVGEALADHMARYPGSRLFDGPNGAGLRPNAFRSRAWRPAVETAGLDPLRVHDLRHTAIALWISALVEPKRIAAWAGHTRVSVILDRYGHLYESDDAAFVERLSAMQDRARNSSASGRVLPFEQSS